MGANIGIYVIQKYFNKYWIIWIFIVYLRVNSGIYHYIAYDFTRNKTTILKVF